MIYLFSPSPLSEQLQRPTHSPLPSLTLNHILDSITNQPAPPSPPASLLAPGARRRPRGRGRPRAGRRTAPRTRTRAARRRTAAGAPCPPPC